MRAELRQATEAAGVFGVPTVECDGCVLWGLASLSRLRDALVGGRRSQGPGWRDAEIVRPAVVHR